jgi:transposase-like protein
MSKECPVCGSTNLKKMTSKEILKGDLDKEIVYNKVSYICGSCHSEGDFFDENSDSINNALNTLKKEYVTSALDYFLEKKISFSSVERVLNLPQRTLTKWKNNVSQPTAAGIALLKFIQLYPWLLEVAEHNYDSDNSQKVFLQTAFTAITNKLSVYQNEYMSK